MKDLYSFQSSITSAFIAAILIFFMLPLNAFGQVYYSADEEIRVIESGEVDSDLLIEADAYGLAVDADGGYIYWSESGGAASRIMRALLDGSGAEVLNDETSAPRGLALDLTNNKIFWADNVNDGFIYRADLDGSNSEVIVDGDGTDLTDGVLDVALDLENEQLYWVRTGAIMRSDLDGSNPEVAVEITSFVQPTAIQINERDGFVYWVDTSSETIMRADLTNGVAETFINADEPYGLSVSVESDQIYWLSDFFFQGTGQISVAALDGTGEQVIKDTPATRGAIAGLAWEMATSTESYSEQPAKVQLHQNYPNPFNPSTVVEFHLPEAMEITVTVYNSLGQQVRVLAENQLRQAGRQSLTYDASALPSGIYLYRLSAAEQSFTRKMTLMK